MKINNGYHPPLYKENYLKRALHKRSVLVDLETRDCPLEEFAEQHDMDRSTLYRLRKKMEKNSGNLVDGRAFNKGRQVVINENLLAWVFCYISEYPKAKIKQVWKEASEVARERKWGKISYRQLLRVVHQMPGDMRSLLQNGVKFAFEHDFLVARRESPYPNFEWQMDATELDIWLVNTVTGGLYRPWMTSVIDSCTRVILAFQIHEKEPTAADAISTLMKAILPKHREDMPFYGIPVQVRTDNHSTYRSVDYRDMLLRLNIGCPEGPNSCPSQNGKIERHFRTFQQQLLSGLAGYSASHNALAKAKKQAIPAPLFPKLAEKYLVRYHLSEHAGVGKKTPWEVWHERLESAHGLLFNAHDVREAAQVRREYTVQRDGVEVVPGKHFSGKCLFGLVGEPIIVRVPVEGEPSQVEAYYRGKFKGVLTCMEGDESLAQEINKERLDRTIEIQKLRKHLEGIVDKNGVVDPHEIARARKNGASKSTESPPAKRKTSRVPKLKSEEES